MKHFSITPIRINRFVNDIISAATDHNSGYKTITLAKLLDYVVCMKEDECGSLYFTETDGRVEIGDKDGALCFVIYEDEPLTIPQITHDQFYAIKEPLINYK